MEAIKKIGKYAYKLYAYKKSVYHIKEKFIVKEQYKWNALSITYTISKGSVKMQCLGKLFQNLKFISNLSARPF